MFLILNVYSEKMTFSELKAVVGDSNTILGHFKTPYDLLFNFSLIRNHGLNLFCSVNVCQCQVTFIYPALLIIQSVSTQLYSVKSCVIMQKNNNKHSIIS